MGDAGEGLIDADARIQELVDEREAARRERRIQRAPIDPVKNAAIATLSLGLSELRRQLAATEHPVRQKQLEAAIADVEKRIKKLG
ncbi:MAG: hypothetical protein HQ485_09870 [Acidobacteria bacterium]|jgi:hypothetical protein|nr:hypothetical protein [Acidobacteriota bacterium]